MPSSSSSSTCLVPRGGAHQPLLSSAADFYFSTASESAAAATRRAESWSFVRRNGSRLVVPGDDSDSDQSFVAVGPNVYWLGLDENVEAWATYPTRTRVLEALAIAAAVGATAIRSTSLGVSVGDQRSVMPSLGHVNDDAFDAIDFALFAAKRYGLRLVIPLTDQYDYYHGGIATFLRWRSLAIDDFAPFYDTSSVVYDDFEHYVSTLLSHRSNWTGLTMGDDPTVLAFETGNELGGWTRDDHAPPVSWTRAIAAHIRSLAPLTLIMSGSYGVRQDELGIPNVDMVSDHFYPLYTSTLQGSAAVAQSGAVPFLVGEYDWTDTYHMPLLYLVVIVPAVIAALVWLLPRRWWPWRVPCCWRPRRRVEASELSTPDLALKPGESYPPSPVLSTEKPRRRQGVLIRRWHVSVAILALCAVLAGLIYVYLPVSLSAFLSTARSLESKSQLSGALYWSLFGRDDACCHYVQHADGYTLHFPVDMTTRTSTTDRIVELVKSAYRMRRTSPSWLNGSLDDLTLAQLPQIACPQAPLFSQ